MRARVLSCLVLICACRSERTVTPAPPSPSVHAVAPSASATDKEPEPLTDAATWKTWTNVDYLVLASKKHQSALAPLVAHRTSKGHVVASLDIEAMYAKFSGGKPTSKAITSAIESLAIHTKSKLRYVLLVGDALGPTEASSGFFVPIPTNYMSKLDYEHHDSGEHGHPLDFILGGHAHDGGKHTGEKFASDDPYGRVKLASQPKPLRLAVGRLPVRTIDEVESFVKRIVAYETSEIGGAWQRRLVVTAGPASYGAVADGVIESVANNVLDTAVPYDFDLAFTFAKLGSPYAYRFDKMSDHFVSDLSAGALIATYVGHGAAESFDDVHFKGDYYYIGTGTDAARVKIAKGHPVFFSFSCDTGAYDMPYGRKSLAESLVLNPDGPIAVFASSRESHPYPNALYGRAVARKFLAERPKTLGDGLLDLRDDMRGDSISLAEVLIDTDVDALKTEHEGLYNLLGDPATRLRYPAAATVKITSGESVKPGTKIAIDVTAPESVKTGTVRVTLETGRTVVRGDMATAPKLEAMTKDAAFAAMAKMHAQANDKVVIDRTLPLGEGGKLHLELDGPKTEGTYHVKAIVESDGNASFGHASFSVDKPTAK